MQRFEAPASKGGTYDVLMANELAQHLRALASEDPGATFSMPCRIGASTFFKAVEAVVSPLSAPSAAEQVPEGAQQEPHGSLVFFHSC